MKVTSRRLSIEDFKEQSAWIGPLLSAINQTLQELQPINSNQLTIADNLNQELLEFKFVNDAVAFPVKLRTKFNQMPKGLTAVYCMATDGTTATNTPWLDYSFTNQLLTINSITNLTSAKTYTLRLLLIYG